MSTGPDRQSAKRRIQAKEAEDPALSDAIMAAKREEVELAGRQQFYDLRKRWSFWIIVWISFFILFHAALTGLVGMRLLDFSDAKWLIPLIVVENFLQIVGMGYIVVRFLYPGTR